MTQESSTNLSRHLPNLAILTTATILSTLLLWLPFFLNLETLWTIPLPEGGMSSIVANYDGPYYLTVAKSLYNPEVLQQFEFDLPYEYYAAHYPLYPLTIRALSLITNYPYAMLASTIIFSVLATLTLYFLVTAISRHSEPSLTREESLQISHSLSPTTKNLLLTTIFLFFPARYFILRSVGSPEPLFLFLILLSLLGMVKKNYWLAGIAGALAQLTKPPAILLFPAFTFYLIWPYLTKFISDSFKTKLPKFPRQAFPLLLIPLALLGLWYFYSLEFGSLFAYFQSGDNIHLFWPPFQIFNRTAAWVGTFWLEDVIWLFLITGIGLIYLIKQGKHLFAWLAGIWLASIFFVSHRDLSRYALPIFPLILTTATPILENKYTKYLLLLLLIPIYLYSLNFIAGNLTPISDWSPLL